ncbi:uncharacterized protein C8A04DRAFT_13997 [Dichotomopilus funicola]|uniref:Dehydrogenase FUB6 n=1 Tax=Dichotomopilus funicola TaxID=1934379 RepID=A0AAN6UYF5_9PEZI|nr:hypothetical protein C8A04DRAFT_13997 [Dichotomopilus funicola]
MSSPKNPPTTSTSTPSTSHTDTTCTKPTPETSTSTPIQNKTLLFHAIPPARPIPNQHLSVQPLPFDLSAPPPPGGLTVAILYSSIDPYQRSRMRPAHIKSYQPAFELGGAITNYAVARVVKSDTAAPALTTHHYRPGDLLYAFLPTAEYATITAEELPSVVLSKITNHHSLPDLGLFLGPLGMPGLTGWASLHEIGQPKPGETIFISSAAGAVGQVVGQIAKREGLKVIGSVGSEEKLRYIVEELGFDGGFNYKREKPKTALKRLAPGGIDIYYENVGGEHLEAALGALRDFGRVVVSGMISQYNATAAERYGVSNLTHIISKRLTIRGFIVSDPGFWDKYFDDHQEKMQQWLADGSFKAKLHVIEGIDNAAEALVSIFEGKNFGKTVLKIQD